LLSPVQLEIWALVTPDVTPAFFQCVFSSLNLLDKCLILNMERVKGNRTLVISLEDFSFEQEQNIYICPAGKVLATTGQLFNDGETLL
jgi:hypothetical protein